MSKKDKLLNRIKTLPKDFTFNELETLLTHLGFEINNKGKTSGSRVKFYHNEKKIQFLAHKPHPTNIIKEKLLKSIVEYLIENDF